MADSDRPTGDESSTENTPPDSSSETGGKENFASWHQLAGVGVEFIVAVGLFAALGWWLDSKWNTRPWLLIAGCGVGFAAGLFQMVRAAQKMMK